MAELSQRPFPPGSYPVIVVGSGPGGLQVSYSLSRLGVEHAVLSADDAPGGMFRRWPFFQRLLSWTKPYAPVDRGDRAYERYDWNSLLADEPENRAIMPDLMDGTSYFPSRPAMQENLETFVAQTGIKVRYGCTWTGTRINDAPEGGFILETSDGEYRAATVVFAVGVAQPYFPGMPGVELTAHYADTRPAQTYADKRVYIIGKQNSGFELASGLLHWAKRIVVASPSPAKLSVNTRSLVGVRARYVQPIEDHALGGGVAVLDAATQSIVQRGDGTFEVTARPSAGGDELKFDVDEVIAATGFVTPLGDLPDLGIATFGQSRLPAQTPYWESPTVPGIFFAGTISQGAGGLKKHGLPANSGAVHGARYNGRLLARHIARTRPGAEAAGGRVAEDRPLVAAADLADTLVGHLQSSSDLWHQRAYLARVISLDPTDGPRDEGVVPLAAFVDGAGDDGSGDAIALTLEADGTGSVYPVVYVRQGGRLDEHAFEPDILLRFDTPDVRARMAQIVKSAAKG